MAGALLCVAEAWFAYESYNASLLSPGGAGRAERCDSVQKGWSKYLFGNIRSSEKPCVRMIWELHEPQKRQGRQ